jgi:hypothetical protein
MPHFLALDCSVYIWVYNFSCLVHNPPPRPSGVGLLCNLMNGAMQEAMAVAIRSASVACWICSKTVDIKDCVTDEHGRSVHEPCYVTRLALESATRKRPR